MCSSRIHDRILGQIEWYLDDLVDCFEEFVKKSMVVISVAVGTLVLMVLYILKIMSERVASRGIDYDTIDDTECFDKRCQVSIQDLTETTPNNEVPCSNTKSLINAFVPSAVGTTTVSLQVIPNNYANFDDTFTKAIERCSIITKLSDPCKQTQVSEDLKSARILGKLTTTITTWEPCISKSHLPVSLRNSCCSLCCENEHCNM